MSQEHLSNKEFSNGDTCISLGLGNRIDFISRMEVGEDVKRKDHVGMIERVKCGQDM